MDWFGDTFFIISTHAPLAGRDRSPTLATGSSRIFQPTRPLRGATTRHIQRFARTLYFNPRAPCGARRSLGWVISSTSIFQPTRPLRGATKFRGSTIQIKSISTHAPLAGRDITNNIGIIRAVQFQPTRPLRGATISDKRCKNTKRDFNPRAPCGARQNSSFSLTAVCLFQPTRPLRGATRSRRYGSHYVSISTHAPLAGRDLAQKFSVSIHTISTHAPLAGRDYLYSDERMVTLYFNPRAPCGARQ